MKRQTLLKQSVKTCAASIMQRICFRLFIALLLSSIGSYSFAQVCLAPGSVTGVPKNAYYQGAGTANSGSSTVTVGNVRSVNLDTSSGDTSAIQAGDTIFIIQMQGASIDNSNTSSYGDGIIGGGQGYTSLNSTGLYEFATVESVSGSTLTLREPLNHSYESSAATAVATRKTFQVIRVPRFYNYTLNNSATVTQWNGRTGGVYILDIVNNLTIDGGTIDASEAGFRGAGGVDMGIINGAGINDFAVINTSGNGAFKGEGIAGTPSTVNGGPTVTGYDGQSANLTTADQGFAGDLGYPNELDRARGAPGNAGGGGDEHNAGGAGGANFGAGGNGGASFAFYQNTPGTNCTDYGGNFYACGGDGSRPVGGVEGAPLNTATVLDYESRLFMGGGGGAGANNNADDDNPTIAQSSGGSGGGIIVIRTNNITDNATLNLLVNGGVGQDTGRDGAGGGGAGGTALVLAAAGTYSINVTANGGIGGRTGLPLNGGETQGPGGGGGGGAALVSSVANIGTVTTLGGAGGINEPVSGVLNPILAGSGDGSSVEVNYDPQVIDISGACGEDFGDAAGYADARHVLIRQIFMGAQVPDQELNTLSDDNSFEAIDEDGLLTLPTLTDADTSYSVDVQVSNETGIAGTLFGWIDLNGNNVFELTESTSTPVASIAGSQTISLNWGSLPGITAGSSQLRLRVTTDTSVTTSTPSGFAEDGEVEDHALTILAGGDVCTYPTADGIWHFNSSVLDSSTNARLPGSNSLVTSDFNTQIFASGPSAPLFNGDVVNLDDDGDGGGSGSTFLNQGFSQMTVTFWLKPESFTGTQTIWDEGGGTNGVVIRLNGTTLEARVRDNFQDIDLSVGFPQDNRWHHIGLVYNNETAELFLDGASADAGANAAMADPINDHTDPARLGSSSPGTPYGTTADSYTGYLDELVYWTSAASGGVAGSADQSANMAAIAACVTPVIREDYGDAPDTGAGTGLNNYETLDSNNGPRHMLGTDLYLGDVSADDDADASPGINADGDDSGDGVVLGNDENAEQLLSSALTFSPILTTSDTYQLVIDVTNNAAAAANLYAWIDFDRSGTFDDTEIATVSGTTVANTGDTTVTLDWSGLLALSLTEGDTYLRLRLTTDALTDGLATEDGRSLGYASNGEIEDHKLNIAPPPDFGDAPAIYGDAWHNVLGVSTLQLGVLAGDGETTTQLGGDAGVGADGDDTNGSDDEDALDANGTPDLNIASTSYSLPVDVINTGAAARLVAWLDFDRSNSFDDDEFATVAVTTSGTVNLVWNNISSTGPDISAGATYLRLRLSRDTSVANTTALTSSSIGGATDGEIEDYELTILGSDFGDAPLSYGVASHQLLNSPVLYLGTGAPDEETATQLEADAGANADGDDNDGGDDENAIASFTPISDASTGIYSVNVNVSNTGPNANLMGWIDFNGNNVFDIPAEAANAVVTVTTTGVYTLNFTIPGTISAGSHYARFRVTTETLSNSDAAGSFISGEVEDYPFAVADSNAYFVEAECGVIGNEWTAVSDPLVSQSTYLQAVTGRTETALGAGVNAADYALYSFNLPATGTFDVYALANFADTGSNSFSTSLDNTTWTLFDNGGFHTSSIWDWRLTTQTITGTAGQPIDLYIAYQEADSQIDKFAIVTTGSPAPTGLGDAALSCLDFGDAPDPSIANGTGNYTTSLTNVGPYHALGDPANLFIGTIAPDIETDALQNVAATGDDSNDEQEADLATGGLPTLSTAVTAYNFTANVFNNKGVNASLYAWIDNDRDGVFEDTELATGAPYTVASTGASTTVVSWAGLTATTVGDYAIRLRLTTDQGLPGADGGEDERSIGVAIDGEVEDYIISAAEFDYGDAPVAANGDYDDTNNDGVITGADNAANHIISPGLRLGTTDPDADTSVWFEGTDTSGTAEDDDNQGVGDDEDGVSSFASLAQADSTYTVSVIAANSTLATANIYAWIDFDANGSFEQDERATIATMGSGGSGTINLNWSSIPADIVAGNTFARIRITTDSLDIVNDGTATDDASLGQASNGEIEDYALTINSSTDFGDAPLSLGIASHIISADLFLGTLLADVEASTLLGGDAGVSATGDDTDNTIDEDGIASFPPINDTSASYQLTLTVNNTTGAPANVYAWIDFDGSGDFDEDERATLADDTVTGTTATTIPDSASGTVLLNWASLPGITSGTTYIRVRTTSQAIDVATQTNTQDDASIGLASNGEVEDYALIIADSTQVFFEAECGVIGNVWTTVYNTAVSERVYIDPTLTRFGNLAAAEPIPNMVQYQINIPVMGTYDLYALVDAPDNTNDSFHYSFDNNTWSTVNGVNGLFTGFGWLNAPAGAGSGQTITTAADNEVVNLFISYREGGNLIDKFAFLTTGSPLPTGLGNDVGSCFDFGDAPDTTLNTNGTADYTTLIDNTVPGPFNAVDNSPAVFLGDTAPDTENDALQSTNADGDTSDEGETQLISTTGGDAFPVLTVDTTTYTINIDVTNNKAVDAQLMAWIDFDRNGVFDEDERQSATITASAGAIEQPLQWTGLSGLTQGDVYARFRLSTDPEFIDGGATAGLDPQSLNVLIDGETEDYRLTIFELDYGDAPVDNAGDYDDTSGDGTITGGDNPAAHIIVSGINLGSDPDGDSGVWGNGADSTSDPAARAVDDDLEGSTPDDEDSLTVNALSTIDTSYSLELSLNNGDILNDARILAWIDFDQNGRFDEDERATLLSGGASPVSVTGTYTVAANVSGTVQLNWSSLPGISSGNTYLRVRISTDTSWSEGALGGTAEDTASVGLVNNGEVEDYEIIVSGVDFGDAPVINSGDYDDTNNDGTVNASDSPASHVVVAGIRLGAEDPDGESMVFSDGIDDFNNASDDDQQGSTPDDEDGIVSAPAMLLSDTSYQATIAGVNGDALNAATLAAWIDFDGSGSFDEDERASGTIAASTSNNVVLNWTVPAGAVAGTRYLRIRLSTDPAFVLGSNGGVDEASVGPLNNGEVEDHPFTILNEDFGDAPVVTIGGFDDGIAARHGIVAGIRLGSVDPDADTGRYGDSTEDLANTASDDDTPNDPVGGVDDEDGIASFTALSTSNTSYQTTLSVSNSAAIPANVYAWIDFDQDGIWEESERATLAADSITPTGSTVAAGVNGTILLNWSGLSGLSQGNAYVRVRITTDTIDITDEADNGVQDDAAVLRANDGEVEDYLLSIVPSLDFGDVPIVTAGDYDDGNFAQHNIVANIQLGTNAPDIDSGAWGNGVDVGLNALDDDSEGSTPDDEDGISSFAALNTSQAGSTYSLSLTVLNNTGSDANIYAWVDFDNSKTFDETELATLSAGSITPNGAQSIPTGVASGTVSLDWTVPNTVSDGTTYVRVRITSQTLSAIGGGEDERSAGAAIDGEVEDYQLNITAIDFGDAPDTSGANGINDYTTLSANGGPSHVVVTGLYLGSAAADGDTNGFEEGVDDNGLASDDENGGDEGIAQLLSSGTSFPALDTVATTYSFAINAFNNTGSNARIYAWIDFDRNGLFDEDELAGSSSIGLSSTPSLQVKTVQWTSLPGISAGATYMRLRVTTDNPTASGSGEDERSIGSLNGGEVEDYLITVGNLDYGDAPAPHKTLLADDGPRHIISNNLYLGDSETGNVINNVLTDLDNDGYADGIDDNGNASDDDLADNADENLDDLVAAAAVFPELRTSSSSYTLNVNYNNNTGSAARIYAWIDFDQSGTFDVDEATEGLFGQGDSQIASLNWASTPNDIQGGNTYIRLRITSSPLTAPASGEDTRSYGLLSNGEVEDHQINIVPIDFGDAPSTYNTFLANSGPNHVVNSNLFIGTVVADGDANGFANGVVDSADATDDDTEGSADEGISDLLNSGATSFPVLDASSDTGYTLVIDATNNTAANTNLYGWIDFDNNGDFDSDELASAIVPPFTIDSPISLNWGTAAGGSSLVPDTVVSVTYARFRIRSDANTSPLGSAPDGEVEDYQFNISGDSAISGTVFEDVNYGGGNGRNYATSNLSYSVTDVATPATVELWASDGTTCTGISPVATVNSPDGNYSFSGAVVAAPASYCVRVVTSTVESNRTGYVPSLVSVPTYRAESTDGSGAILPITTEVGGRFPVLADTLAGSFNASQTSAWSIVTTNGPAVNNVDFGFNFNTIVNTNNAGQGSLRQFINNANALDNANIAQQGQTSLIDVSIFEIPSNDPNYNITGQSEFVITPTSLLSTITDPVEVNGATQSGVVCPAPKIQLSGLSTAGNGINISAGSSTVRGLILNNWSSAGINLSTNGNNQIDCNYIGINAAGAVSAPNGTGMTIGSNSNTVGGTFAARSNVISGNTNSAISITADQNIIQRNHIGVAANGLSRLENGSHGILINGVNNEVGSSSTTASNTIAYNNGDAIRVIGGAASLQNEFRINKIFNNAGLGIDLTGDGITANDTNDVDTGENDLLNRPVISNVTVGGNDLTIDGNIEVGSGVYTLEFYANPVCNSDQNGIAQVATAGESLQFLGSISIIAPSANTYTFPSPQNTLSGIVPSLVGGVITAKIVEDNGNTSEFSDCFTAIAPQVISGTVFEDINYGGGLGRSFAASSGIGIPATVELWTSDGVNCTGGAPVQAVNANPATGAYSFATAQPGAEYCVRVVNNTVESSRSGWTSGILPVQTYRVDYDDDGGGYSLLTDRVGGESPRDEDSAAGVIDIGAGDGARTQSLSMIDLPVAGDINGIDFGYNFSTVVNVNSSGQGSLSQFISNANTLGGKAALVQAGNRINGAGLSTEALPSGIESSIFMISNGGATDGLTADYPNLLSGAGVAQINVSTTETITQPLTSLDATTQSVNVFGNNGVFYNNGNTVGRNATSQGATMLPEVELSGSTLSITAANVQVRGLSFLPTSTALSINTTGGNQTLEQNAFGVSAISLSEPGSGSTGNLVEIAAADNVSVTNNVFGFGDQAGLLFGNDANNLNLEDNLFQGLSGAGVLTTGGFSCSSFNRNQFIANNIGASFVNGSSGIGCIVQNSSFEQSINNGIDVNFSTNAQLEITDNLISQNSGDGVSVNSSTTGILISQNHIFNNGDLGIDLGADGLSVNDGTDADSGANNLMNFPVISSVTADGATATITATLTSNQATPLSVQLYSSSVCNGNTSGVSQSPDYGEGEIYHSSTGVTSGVPFNVTVDTSLLAGPYISLLASDNNGNTSEFSQCAFGFFDDYGDAPDTYGTTAANNGAAHRTRSTLFMGASAPDPDQDGFVDGIDNSTTADDDDTDDANDDEDAIVVATQLNGLTAANLSFDVEVDVNNTTLSLARLVAWVDFDGSGTFDTDEAATIDVPNGTSGNVTLSWASLPIDITPGATFARFRLTTDNAIATGVASTSVPTGFASDGEVEDYAITILPGTDYGDAPDSYRTATASNGARHFISDDLALGFVIDGELSVSAASLGTDADLDDTTDLDDEESSVPRGIRPSDTSYVLEVQLQNTSGTTATLYGWIDIDQDGVFDENELSSQAVPSGATVISLNWTLSGTMTQGNTYLRLRLTTDVLSDTVVDGDDERSYGSASDGEVEDYIINISELTCDVLYGIYDDTTANLGGGFAFADIRDFDPDTNTVGPVIGSLTTGGANPGGVTAPNFGTAAVGLERFFRRFYYTEWAGNPDDGGAAELGYFDGVNHVNTGLTVGAAGPDNYNRLAHSFAGQGYVILTGAPFTLVRYDVIAGAPGANNLTILGDITGITNGVGGDIAFDRDDNMYMVTYTTGNPNNFFLYRIDNYTTAPAATLLLTSPALTGQSIAGMAFAENGDIYLQGTGGTTFQWNVAFNTLTQITNATSFSADMASCIYPILRPIVEVTKTVDVVASANPGFIPGDTLEYTIIVKNVGGIAASLATLQDTIPTGTTYIPNSTTVNGVAVADTGADMPFEVASAINTAGQASGVLITDTDQTTNEVVVKFQVTVDNNPLTTQVCNTSTVTFDDGGFGGNSPVVSDDPTDLTGTTDPTCVDKFNGFGIFGSVYEDVNVDQVFDGSESGLGSITIVLRDNGAGTCSATTTAADGSYDFFPVESGNYTIYEAAGESATFPNCPPTQADLNGYQSSTPNSIDVTVTNANLVDQDFGDVRPPIFSPNNASIVQPGNSVVYGHVLSPRTDGNVSFSFNESTIPVLTGWSVTLYQDNDCSSTLNGGDIVISGSLAVSEGVDICILTRVTAPGSASAGNQHVATVTANFDYPGIFVSNSLLDVVDTTTVVSADDGALLLIKTVENLTTTDVGNQGEKISNEGEPGDELLYRVKFQNVGTTPITNVDIFDTTPAFTRVSVPIDCNDARGPTATIPTAIPSGLSCTIISPVVIDNAVGYTGAIQWQLLGTLAAGETGLVVFSVTID